MSDTPEALASGTAPETETAPAVTEPVAVPPPEIETATPVNEPVPTPEPEATPVVTEPAPVPKKRRQASPAPAPEQSPQPTSEGVQLIEAGTITFSLRTF